MSKLVISLNRISKSSKNSEYSIAFGGIVKFKPLHKTDFSWLFKLYFEKLSKTLPGS